jgi:general stress protein YciG
MTTRNNEQSNTSNRGFASMDEDKQREIASQGGKAAHEKGTAHEFSHEEAVEAGRKGGQASHGGGRSSEQDDDNNDQQSSKGKQGFAAMDKDKQREIASKGGKH